MRIQQCWPVTLPGAAKMSPYFSLSFFTNGVEFQGDILYTYIVII